MADAFAVPQRARACKSCARSKAKCVWANKEKDGVKVCER